MNEDAGRNREVMAAVRDALLPFGMIVPESDEEIQAAIEAEEREVEMQLRGRAIADLADAPTVSEAGPTRSGSARRPPGTSGNPLAFPEGGGVDALGASSRRCEPPTHHGRWDSPLVHAARHVLAVSSKKARSSSLAE
jgi:hypothetical protein